ncbi:hypothetical protein [Novosphingobium ginsenosidimutans]|uniref:DUF1311 domain-containing protein n=1 Tax=Novosphingobium ginsenosidimutans TaxID=1176536 RepID=A0A5B8S3G9_9SPHN|nr:hypothetical protein [Novosphingobium ginsenosidimutans]QEA16066.1 hypothetical protein FRF71_07920 [Novosphingobium ginsenosidimutans]
MHRYPKFMLCAATILCIISSAAEAEAGSQQWSGSLDICKQSASAVAEAYGRDVAKGDLAAEVKLNLWREKKPVNQSPDSYDAILSRSTGRSPPETDVRYEDIQVLSSSSGKLVCRAVVTVDKAVKSYVDWMMTSNGPRYDSWDYGPYQGEQTTIENALANPGKVHVFMSDEEMTLAEAREKRRLLDAKAAIAEQNEAARAAYANSPAGRAEAARQSEIEQKRLRAIAEDFIRRGRACTASGGTWGYRNSEGIHYWPSDYVPKQEYLRSITGCYHL